MSEVSDFCSVDRAGGVLTLCFNRAEVGNTVPQDAVPELTRLFHSVLDDRSVRAVLIRGEGKHFCTGGDVRSFGLSLGQTVAERRADFGTRLDRVKEMVEAYLAIPVPVIAACQGAVAGAGLLFALGADYVIADWTVTFLFSHQRVGLPPDGGVSFLLPRVVGLRRAGELVLTAAKVSADEAYRIGLVSRLVAAEGLHAETVKQALRFSKAPANVTRVAKQLIAASAVRTIADQLNAERDAIVGAVGDADFEEGVRAFLEKRPADFPSTY